MLESIKYINDEGEEEIVKCKKTALTAIQIAGEAHIVRHVRAGMAVCRCLKKKTVTSNMMHAATECHDLLSGHSLNYK